MTTVKEELESAWNPNDVVLAVISDPAKSLEACQALREAGFPSEDVAVFRGEEATERLDIEGKRLDDPFLRPLRALWGYLSLEGHQLRAYEQASEAGEDILAVRAETDEQVTKAHAVLLRFDATEIRRFTQWNISDLPDDRPAA